MGDQLAGGIEASERTAVDLWRRRCRNRRDQPKPVAAPRIGKERGTGVVDVLLAVA